ncbi:phosphonate C-P lyase system protein PhnH [Afifella pfennigii]|uniref:phosphonate C-P lyase system protein PhnH n=1 Tax=Afifella pfennigii TaxID=209897 RepID=UPI00047B0398|nr:phosphonate C-P lyase system protein PhnH [Afifella pfennigii]
MKTDALSGGFTDPVFGAQAVFRGLLRALSRPGEIENLPDLVRPPAPLCPAAAAVIACLADADTPIFLDPPLAGSEAVRQWLGFHVGAPIVSVPGRAAFAVIADAAGMPPLASFWLGTEEYPDRSTILVVQVKGFCGAQPLRLQGPGIAETAELRPEPLPERLVRELKDNRALFPRGVDLVLAAPAAIAGLPRSTRILEGAG